MAIATFDELFNDSPYVSDDMVKLAKSLTTKNLFLSHSLADLKHAKWALGILENHGARVYVDVRDAALTSMAVTDIAARLRAVIRECKRLVALVTENTSSSRWIPWEMGLADAVATEDRVALFPLRPASSSSEAWARQEYFALYPRIEREYSYVQSKNTYVVHLPRGGTCSLSEWLNRSRPSSR
ncbi:MAG: toll/interleukin-1 receptor domain-containing protein [Kofleriaceae bacterium]